MILLRALRWPSRFLYPFEQRVVLGFWQFCFLIQHCKRQAEVICCNNVYKQDLLEILKCHFSKQRYLLEPTANNLPSTGERSLLVYNSTKDELGLPLKDSREIAAIWESNIFLFALKGRSLLILRRCCCAILFTVVFWGSKLAKLYQKKKIVVRSAFSQPQRTQTRRHVAMICQEKWKMAFIWG
jgi:hypothetical protein